VLQFLVFESKELKVYAMIFDKIKDLNLVDRKTFYQILSHNITISIRGIWSDKEKNDDEKVESLVLANEIMHRVTKAVLVLERNEREWDDDLCGRMIEDYIEKDVGLRQEIAWSIESSYKNLTSRST